MNDVKSKKRKPKAMWKISEGKADAIDGIINIIIMIKFGSLLLWWQVNMS